MKKKFTFIDVLIVIVLIAAIAICAVMFLPRLGASESAEAEFTVLVSSQDPEVAEAMSVGDTVTLSYTDKDSGTVTDVRTELAESMTFDSINGEYRLEDVEGKVDIYVTVKADVSVSDTYIKAGDTIIRVGSKIPLRGKGYVASGYVIELEEN